MTAPRHAHALRDRLMALGVECLDRDIDWKKFVAGILPPGTGWKTLTEEQVAGLEKKFAEMK